MVQSHVVRALFPQLAPTADRFINSILTEGVWDLAADHYKVVQQSAAAMSVRVGSGTQYDKAVVAGDAAGQETFIVRNEDPRSGDGNGDLSIANGGAQDRIDTVVLRVWEDPFDSSGLWKGEVEVVQGDEAASPAPPALPDTAIRLADVAVAAGLDSGITNGMITDRRTQAGPAPIITRYVDSATSPAVQSYTPNVDASVSGVNRDNDGVREGAYVIEGGICTAWARVVMGSSGTFGDGAYIIDLPVAAAGLADSSSAGNGSAIGSGHLRDDSAPGNNVTVGVQLRTSTTVSLVRASGGFVTHNSPLAWGTSDVISFMARYPVAA